MVGVVANYYVGPLEYRLESEELVFKVATILAGLRVVDAANSELQIAKVTVAKKLSLGFYVERNSAHRYYVTG